MEARISAGEWLLENLIGEDNNFNLKNQFKSKESALEYFDTEDAKSITDFFLSGHTKKQIKDKNNKIERIGADLPSIGLQFIDYFNLKEISDREVSLVIFLLESRLNSIDFNFATNLLTNYSFGDFADENDIFYRSIGIRGADHANQTFVSGIIGKLSESVINEFMTQRSSELFKKHAKLFYKKALVTNAYVFEKVDVDNFKDKGIALHNLADSHNFFFDEANSELEHVINDLITFHNKGELSANDIRLFILGNRYDNQYKRLLALYPILSSIRTFNACHSLECIKGSKSGNLINDLWEKKPTESQNPLEFLSDFGKALESSVILTHVAHALSKVSIGEVQPSIKTTLSLLDREVLSNYEIGLVDDLETFTHILSKSEEIPRSKMKNIGLSLLSERIEPQAPPLLTFNEQESGNWWDGGVEVLYGSVNISAHDSIKGLTDSDLYKFYSNIIDSGMKSGSYYFVVSQAKRLCSLSYTKFNLGEAETFLIDAIRNISKKDFLLISNDNKVAAFYMCLKHDLELAKMILDSINTMGLPNNENDENNEHIKSVVSKNLKTLSQCIMQKNDSYFNDLFELQPNVIGRVSRNISSNDGIFSLALTMLIEEGSALKLSTSTIEISASEDTNDEDYVWRRPDYERIFTYKHFPRLKNQLSHEQINVLIRYLKNNNLLINASGEDESSKDGYHTEGVFTSGNTLFIIGEFKWEDIINSSTIDEKGSIEKITFLTVLFDTDDKEFIKETSLTINSETVILMHILAHMMNIQSINMRSLMSGGELSTQLSDCLDFYLPKIEFEGIVHNQYSTT